MAYLLLPPHKFSSKVLLLIVGVKSFSGRSVSKRVTSKDILKIMTHLLLPPRRFHSKVVLLIFGVKYFSGKSVSKSVASEDILKMIRGYDNDDNKYGYEILFLFSLIGNICSAN